MAASLLFPHPVPRLDVGEPARVDPPDNPDAWPDASGGVFALCETEGGRHRMDLPGLTTFRFDARGEAVAATPAPGVERASVVEAYRHAALPLVLHALGREVLHASAVRFPAGVVAFAGESGAGKSTIAWGLSRLGHPIVADDAVALAFGRDLEVEALPFDVRLRPRSAHALGLGPKAVRVDPDATEPRRRLPLSGVCVLAPRADASADVGVSRCRPAEALSGVLAHAFCFSLKDVSRKRLMMCRYLELVRRVPVYVLRVPDGLDRLPAALDALERAIGPPTIER